MVEAMHFGTPEPDLHACENCGLDCHCSADAREEEEKKLFASIRSCPFCGASGPDSVDVEVDDKHYPSHYVGCKVCGVKTARKNGFANAIKAWNTRTAKDSGGAA